MKGEIFLPRRAAKALYRLLSDFLKHEGTAAEWKSSGRNSVQIDEAATTGNS